MDFNYVLKIFIKFFFVTFVIFCASISYSQDDEFNLESDDFDLLEDSSFDQLELELEKNDNLILADENDVSDLKKSDEVLLSKSLDGFTGGIIQNFVYGLQNPPDIFNRNKKGIERVETILNLDFKGELAPQFNFKIGGNFRYDWGKWKNNKFQTNENSTKFNIKDFYLDYYPSSQIWLRIGNQIIARGQLDNLSITDTINPRDLSIPGQGELSEIRQQVPAILLNFPISDLKVELVVTSRAGGNLMGEKGGSFDPAIPFSQNLVNTGGNPFTINYLNPSNELEFFTNINYSFNGGDISLVFSDENQNQRSLKNIKSKSLLSQLDFGFDRIQILGINGNLARGDFLLKYEGANISGASFLKANLVDLPGLKKNQNILGLGFDYSGINNLTIGYEGNLRIINNHSDDLTIAKQTLGHSVQFRWTGLNDLLSINANLSRLTGEKSTIASLVTSYKPRDGLTLFARYVQYDAFEITDTLYPYKKQDVIMLSSEYSF